MIIYSFYVFLLFFIFILIIIIYSTTNEIRFTDVNKNEREYTSVILIHTSNPSQFQKERYLEWKDNSPSDYLVVLLTDKCNLQLKNVLVTCITPNIMIKTYPSLKNMSGYCSNKSKLFYMWTMPFEHIMIWINSNNLKYKYLWIIEQDLSYSGNFFNFFQKYDNKQDDLIVLPYVIHKNDSGWMWLDCFTEEYRKWKEAILPVKSRVVAPTNIARWSNKFIYYMNKNMKLKRHTQSEGLMAEFASFNNLSIRVIEKDDIGYKCSYSTRISMDEWNLINTNPLTKNKLFHALKF